MSTLRTRFTVPVAIIIAIAITPALAGCFGNPIESIIEGATGGQVDLGGTSVPDGFPNEVPLASGEVLFGGSLSDGTSKVFNVTMKVTGGSPVDAIKAQLEGAGLASQADIGGVTQDGGTLVYASDAWGVLVVIAKDGSDWTVNYTVTSSEQ